MKYMGAKLKTFRVHCACVEKMKQNVLTFQIIWHIYATEESIKRERKDTKERETSLFSEGEESVTVCKTTMGMGGMV